MDSFWLEDPMTLLKYPQQIFPRQNQTVTQRLNALSRMVLYASVLAWAATSLSVKALTVGCVILFVIALVQKNHTRPDNTAETFYVDPSLDPFSSKTCQRPTADNPFMNMLVDHEGPYLNACRGEPTELLAEKMFLEGTAPDPWDLFSKKSNNSRPWVTVPNRAVPENKDFYAGWLYRDGKTCKDNSLYCDPKTYGMNIRA